MNLVKTFMKRVTLELESVQNSERESSQESLVLQGVNFAYRAHQVYIIIPFLQPPKHSFFGLFVHFFGAITQFAGGLDAETLCAFEEIRQRFQGSSAGSRDLLAANANANASANAVPSS